MFKSLKRIADSFENLVSVAMECNGVLMRKHATKEIGIMTLSAYSDFINDHKPKDIKEIWVSPLFHIYYRELKVQYEHDHETPANFNGIPMVMKDFLDDDLIVFVTKDMLKFKNFKGD